MDKGNCRYCLGAQAKIVKYWTLWDVAYSAILSTNSWQAGPRKHKSTAETGDWALRRVRMLVMNLEKAGKVGKPKVEKLR